jgi:hypothetical protein
VRPRQLQSSGSLEHRVGASSRCCSDPVGRDGLPTGEALRQAVARVGGRAALLGRSGQARGLLVVGSRADRSSLRGQRRPALPPRRVVVLSTAALLGQGTQLRGARIAGTPTTQGAEVLAEYPSLDAPAVDRFAGCRRDPDRAHQSAHLRGMGWTCESELWGATVNPWDRSLMPGASSCACPPLPALAEAEAELERLARARRSWPARQPCPCRPNSRRR